MRMRRRIVRRKDDDESLKWREGGVGKSIQRLMMLSLAEDEMR